MPEDNTKTDDGAIKVNLKPKADVPEPEKPTIEPKSANDLSEHHELKINAPKQMDSVKTVDKVPETAAPETKVADPTPPIDDMPKQAPVNQSPSAVDAAEDAQNQQMQSPKVFDTTQYHLPIQEHHGGSGRWFWVVTVLLLLVIVGLVVAIDAGWLDLGFSLPFDLIK